MVSTLQGSASSLKGIFVVNTTKLLLLLLLILTWTIAARLTQHKDLVKDIARKNFNNLVEHLPAIQVDWHPNSNPRYNPKSQFNASKVALLIEGQPIPHLVPQLLHMISVVPQDWRFVFLGTNASVISISRSFSLQYHEANGKLDMVILPPPWNISTVEGVYRMLTDMRFYDELLPGVEWLLKFGSDSIMCGNSDDSLNNWLEYSWAGAPKKIKHNRFASSGGLSLRRISSIRRVLGFQARRNDTKPEDEWFGERLIAIPSETLANRTEQEHFSVDDVYHAKPIGYHIRDGGKGLSDNVWKDPKTRKMNLEYCPEVSIILPMKLEKERCDRKKANAK